MSRPVHQARAIQISEATGCWASRSRIVFTIGVTGWCSAKARTGPGMVSVGMKAELISATANTITHEIRIAIR